MAYFRHSPNPAGSVCRSYRRNQPEISIQGATHVYLRNFTPVRPEEGACIRRPRVWARRRSLCRSGDDAASDAPAADGAAVIDTLPDVALVSFDDGTTTTLNDYVGKPLVVNFWASWCPSCVAEMSAAFKPVQERLGDTVTFVGVNIQDSRDKAVELLGETGVQWISVENEDGSLWVDLGAWRCRSPCSSQPTARSSTSTMAR